MSHIERQRYEVPTLNELGTLKAITKGGNLENNDGQGTDTAEPNPIS